jgi:peptidoglycan/LPS O-acetylase OafA/YrhL
MRLVGQREENMSPFMIRALCVVLFISIMSCYKFLLQWANQTFGWIGIIVTALIVIGLALLFVDRSDRTKRGTERARLVSS